MIHATIILDSVNIAGCRLTTIKATYPRFIHAELLTHRVFSRNAASSRAVPVVKMLQRVKDNPAVPIHWGQNQNGMQADYEVDPDTQRNALHLWLSLRDEAVTTVEQLNKLGIHKQVANRLLEPWLHIETLISATEWDNFLRLRNHPSAQPEIQELARQIEFALHHSRPLIRKPGEWHLPFIEPDDIARLEHADLVKVSAARCARVSYYLHDGRKSTLDADLQLFSRLAGAEPKHLSPLEHVAEALRDNRPAKNYCGWQQLRTLYESLGE